MKLYRITKLSAFIIAALLLCVVSVNAFADYGYNTAKDIMDDPEGAEELANSMLKIIGGVAACVVGVIIFMSALVIWLPKLVKIIIRSIRQRKSLDKK